jgi:hypothetical protein
MCAFDDLTLFDTMKRTFKAIRNDMRRHVGAQCIAPCSHAKGVNRRNEMNGRNGVIGRNALRPYMPRHIINCCLPVVACLLIILVSACNSAATTTSTSPRSTNSTKKTISSSGTPNSYSTQPTDVVIRTFYGGGEVGTLDFSPEISIYGNGSYILGPGLKMRWGKLAPGALQQLVQKLVNTYGLLNFRQQQFNEDTDQDATWLELTLNNKQYEFAYGRYGLRPENAIDKAEYHRLDEALATIREALTGPMQPYSNNTMALLVHQDFSPDLSQSIPSWNLSEFSLSQVAEYECGIIPPDLVGPNAATGCLTYTIPNNGYLPTMQELQKIQQLLKGQQEGDFTEQGFYYRVVLRPLLPDEQKQQALAMFGSQQYSYKPIPLHSGSLPAAQPSA